MKLDLYQVDAFADQVFGGNPAAVIPLEKWLDKTLLQKIAQENNLSETAFFVQTESGFKLRWFTPSHEVDLCGHATLAAAHVIFNDPQFIGDVVSFETRSGILTVRREKNLYTLDFPILPLSPCDSPALLIQGLGGITPIQVLQGIDYVVHLKSEAMVKEIKPNMMLLSQLDLRGVCITAQGNEADFVSRFFAPKLAVPEDPVTGSAHCALAPYWSATLQKNDLWARQVSLRGGEIFCQIKGERVWLSGNAVTFMRGQIEF